MKGLGNKKNAGATKGMSLIEAVTGIALLTLLMVPTYAIFRMMSSSTTAMSNKASAEAELKAIMSAVHRRFMARSLPLPLPASPQNPFLVAGVSPNIAVPPSPIIVTGGYLDQAFPIVADPACPTDASPANAQCHDFMVESTDNNNVSQTTVFRTICAPQPPAMTGTTVPVLFPGAGTRCATSGGAEVAQVEIRKCPGTNVSASNCVTQTVVYPKTPSIVSVALCFKQLFSCSSPVQQAVQMQGAVMYRSKANDYQVSHAQMLLTPYDRSSADVQYF